MIFNAEWLISTFGLIGILAVVFAESGLLIGFFLPGDSLLFTAGLLVAGGRYLHYPLWLVCLLVTVAAMAGDQFGYAFGRRVGSVLFRRPNSRVFKQENLVRARQFFDRYGARSIVLARFVFILVGIVAISVAPIALELLRTRGRRRQHAADDQPNAATDAGADRPVGRSPR